MFVFWCWKAEWESIQAEPTGSKLSLLDSKDKNEEQPQTEERTASVRGPDNHVCPGNRFEKLLEGQKSVATQQAKAWEQ